MGQFGTIAHYANGRWTITTPEDHIISALRAVAVLPDGSEGWAVGDNGTFLHLTQGRWHLIASLGATAHFYAVSMLSASDVWAVGSVGTIAHWNGTTWQVVSSPATGNLTGLAMVSATEGWAVGANGIDTNPTPALLHYTGGNWTVENLHLNVNAGIPLNNIVMTSSSEGWITWGVGFLRRSAGHWITATDSEGHGVVSMSMTSATDGWGVSRAGGNAVIMRCMNGIWHDFNVQFTNPLYGVWMVSAADGWAVGDSGLLHYQNGTWQRYDS